jgi:hypothetical protein
MKPFIHLLAILSLDGKLVTGFTETSGFLQEVHFKLQPPIWTDLRCWKGRDQRLIAQYAPTRNLLKQLAADPQATWLIGSPALNASLAQKDWIHSLHLWWRPIFSRPPAQSNLTIPFPIDEGYRRNFRLQASHYGPDGFYGIYKRKSI